MPLTCITVYIQPIPDISCCPVNPSVVPGRCHRDKSSYLLPVSPIHNTIGPIPPTACFLSAPPDTFCPASRPLITSLFAECIFERYSHVIKRDL